MKPTTFKPEENKTYDLFQAYLKGNWSPKAQAAANVFNAFFTKALTAEQVNKIARAVNELSEEGDLTSTLSALVRAKVLRSRVGHKRRLYEVNY